MVIEIFLLIGLSGEKLLNYHLKSHASDFMFVQYMQVLLAIKVKAWILEISSPVTKIFSDVS